MRLQQLRYCPHAIDITRFSKDHSIEAIQLRQKLKIPLDAIVVLFAGKLEQKKNPFLLLKAFVEINRDNVYLLVVGNGELEEELKLEAKEHNGRIVFMDFQNQIAMPVIYQACNLFCLPSSYGETWGLAINEAMSASKAILVSDKVGSAVDLVKDHINGLSFKSNNLDDLKSKLDSLVTDPATLKDMGLQSRQIIENWSFSNQVRTFTSELDKINLEGQ